MSNIQQAREILKRWRKDADAGAWAEVMRNGYHIVDDMPDYGGYLADVEDESTARMIVGTAGNPDLLDAIDGLLTHGQSAVTNPMNEFGVRDWADRIAAAIIAADERMTSE